MLSLAYNKPPFGLHSYILLRYMRLLVVVFLLLFSSIRLLSAQQVKSASPMPVTPAPNYDEQRVGHYTLPNPLLRPDHTTIRRADVGKVARAIVS